MKSVSVGWEYEVPAEEVQEARDSRRAELESYYGAAAESLTDLEVARYLVRMAHPTARYLRPGMGIGFSLQHA